MLKDDLCVNNKQEKAIWIFDVTPAYACRTCCFSRRVRVDLASDADDRWSIHGISVLYL